MSLGRCDREGNGREARDPDHILKSSIFDFSFAVNFIPFVEVPAVGLSWACTQ